MSSFLFAISAHTTSTSCAKPRRASLENQSLIQMKIPIAMSRNLTARYAQRTNGGQRRAFVSSFANHATGQGV